MGVGGVEGKERNVVVADARDARKRPVGRVVEVGLRGGAAGGVRADPDVRRDGDDGGWNAGIVWKVWKVRIVLVVEVEALGEGEVVEDDGAGVRHGVDEAVGCAVVLDDGGADDCAGLRGDEVRPGVGKADLEGEGFGVDCVVHGVGKGEDEAVRGGAAGGERGGVALLAVLGDAREGVHPEVGAARDVLIDKRAYGIGVGLDVVDDGDVPSAPVAGVVQPADFVGRAAEDHVEIRLDVRERGGACVQVVDLGGRVRGAHPAAPGDEEAGGVVGVDGVSGAAGVGDTLADVVVDVGVDGGLGVAVVGEPVGFGERVFLGGAAVVGGVALDGVPGVGEALPAGPGAAGGWVGALDVVRDDEPGQAEVVLARLLEPPVVVEGAVVVDGDRAGGEGVVLPEADLGVAGVGGPGAVGGGREAV